MTTPYTYRVFCKTTQQYYYGVRFAKNCDPGDLFVTYFTSSDYVKELIEKYGKESFVIEIRKIFDSAEQAIDWEIRVNKRTITWENYLNKSAGIRFLLSEEEIQERCKKSLETNKKNKTGIFSITKEEATATGKKCYELGLGFHSITKEERVKIGKKSDQTNRKNGTGIYSITIEEARETGKKCHKLGLGFHSKKAKKKQKETARKPWWNNGETDKKSKTCPGEGWDRGRLTKGKKWWNNGTKEIMSKEQPDNTWIKGRLKWRN